MSAYFLANIRVHDEAEYEKYLEGADEVFSKFSGRYLAVDTSPTILEGEWDYTRVVLVEFPDRESLERWYFSAEYQAILRHRLAGAESTAMVVE